MANKKRLIDANDALERLKKAEKEMKVVSLCGCKAVPMDGVIDFVASRPTVDAVEVVRCECCRSWSRHVTKETRGSCDCLPYHLCQDEVVTSHDFYCPYGERRK